MKKGIYIIPNFITISSLFCGVSSIHASIDGDFIFASYLIILAAFFDSMDGAIARLTKTESNFGVHLDSLSDAISFGVAPAIMAYQWGLFSFGTFGWMAAFLFIASGVLRLARHNVLTAETHSKSFVGLPIPGAAGVIATFIIFYTKFIAVIHIKPILIVSFVYILSMLMVSNVEYTSLKQLDVKRPKPFYLLVLFVLLIYVTVAQHEIIFFMITFLYSLSGPILFLFKRSKKT